MAHFKIGTRSSVLALWQANYVAQKLEEQGHTSELVKFETIGDKKLEVSISKIGSKGVFTEELETALLNNEIDLAVHSAKDMPSELPEGLDLIAFGPREIVNDVLVSERIGISLSGLPKGTIIGSSSTRRRAILKRHYPHLEFVEARGNLQTRLRKLQEGQYAAMLLAYAGVYRLGWSALIQEVLPIETFVPPAGQGAITLEVSTDLKPEKASILRTILNDETSEICIKAERSYLNTLKGGCSIPVFANASSKELNSLTLTSGIISLDGTQEIKISKTIDLSHTDVFDSKVSLAVELGKDLGNQVLNNGGDEILRQIKKSI